MAAQWARREGERVATCGMRNALAAISTFAILATAGCSGSDDKSDVPQVGPSESGPSVVDSPSQSPTPEPVGPTDEDLRKFVELISTNDPDDTMKAYKMTAKGSVARAVLTVYHARDTASQTAGRDTSEPSTITGGQGTFKVCSKEPPCQKWSDFKAKGELIADFSIDKKVMRDRVILGSQRQIRIGDLATARLIGSYKFVSSGGVAVFLEMTAKANVTLGWDTDVYVDPDGAQVAMSALDAPGTLRSGARAVVGYYFPEAELGGEAYLLAVEDGGAQRDENFTIKTG